MVACVVGQDTRKSARQQPAKWEYGHLYETTWVTSEKKVEANSFRELAKKFGIRVHHSFPGCETVENTTGNVRRSEVSTAEPGAAPV
jgi:hypothetical protein